jgi:U3 small nucleolar RNA-associated protein 14
MKLRNTSKWARRALKRGINVMDEGTKDAIAEQLRVGQELRQKVRQRGSGLKGGARVRVGLQGAAPEGFRV